MRPLPDKSISLQSPKRPLLLSLVCLWWFITAPIGILVGLFALAPTDVPGMAFNTGSTLLIVYTSLVFLGFLTMIGMWRMYKWSVLAFGITAVGACVVLLSIAPTSIGGLAGWLAGLLVGGVYFKRMR